MSTIAHIRKTVFKANQAEFATIAGVTQPTVSRWERDSDEMPTLKQMARIRSEAEARGLTWDDRWFFEVPAAETAA